MSQGITIKGKTATGLNLEVAVDSQGQLLLSNPGGTSYITQFYTDTLYTYICKSVPGTALASASWQIKRLDSSGSKRYAGGSTGFTNAATNLATVQGYSYS